MRITRMLATVGALAVVLAVPARAQELNFIGSTAGCFYQAGSCVPASGAIQLAGSGLTYTSGSFDDWSDEDGYLPMFGNLGMFSLTNQNFDYNGWNFVLKVMFTSPPGVEATNGALLQGKVVNNAGSVSINFGNAPMKLASTDGFTTFDLVINDLGVSRGQTNYVNGNVTVTPEPATIGLMVMGLAGLIPVIRRRKAAGATK